MTSTRGRRVSLIYQLVLRSQHNQVHRPSGLCAGNGRVGFLPGDVECDAVVSRVDVMSMSSPAGRSDVNLHIPAHDDPIRAF